MARKALHLALYNHKMARGSWQTNLHGSDGGIKVKMYEPCCFHMYTPRQNEAIYTFGQIAAGPPPTYKATVASNWILPTVQLLTTGDPASAGMPEHDMWKQSNDDRLNGKYFLQSMAVTFSVSSLYNQRKTINYRVDFVVPNRGAQFRAIQGSLPLGIDASNYKLPDALGSFNGLLSTHNRINPLYWKFVRKPVYFRVGPGPMGGSETDAAGANYRATNNEVRRTVRFRINRLFNPRDIGTAAAEQGSAYLSIPDYQQMWCIISSDAVNKDDIVPDVFLTRQFSWRDRVGHAV